MNEKFEEIMYPSRDEMIAIIVEANSGIITAEDLQGFLDEKLKTHYRYAKGLNQTNIVSVTDMLNRLGPLTPGTEA